MVKVFKRIAEQDIITVIGISEMQLGFMRGRGTVDAIFIAGKLQEKYLGNKKTLYYVFVDLEKTFNRVSMSVVRWTMRKLNVDGWLTETVMPVYEFSNRAVRVSNTVDNKFTIKVGVHQRSDLIPLLACYGS